MPGEFQERQDYSLPKTKRLQRTWEFEKVRREGRRLARGALVLNWRETEGIKFSRVGVITPRSIGNAVVRNRARRLMREAFRLHQHDVRAAEQVLVARASIRGRSYAQVERDYLALCKEAKLLLEP